MSSHENLPVEGHKPMLVVLTTGWKIAGTLFLLLAAAFLLLPAMRTGPVGVRRNACINNMRQLGLAVAQVESATKRYPNCTDYTDNDPETSSRSGLLELIRAGEQNSDTKKTRGYSWIVQCLGFMEESLTYDELKTVSNDFATEPFHASVKHRREGCPMSEYDFPGLRCPNFGGSPLFANPNGVYTDYPNCRPVMSNYAALVGPGVVDGVPVVNGVLVPGEANGNRGLTKDDVRDGVSRTIILIETREANYASWLDGATTWVVGAPSDLPVTDNGHNQFQAEFHALNWGVDDPATAAATDKIYLKRGQGWSLNNSQHRGWGPSSRHAGHIVVCAYADGHTQALRDRIDTALFLALISRAGNEQVNMEDM